MANHTSRGQQRDKPFLAALRLEIAEQGEDPKKLRRIAKKLLDKAEEGDTAAIKEVADRLDGKVPQALTGEDGGPIQTEGTVIVLPANGRDEPDKAASGSARSVP